MQLAVLITSNALNSAQVRGPGVPRNKTESHIVLNIDVAPTFVDIATGSVPDDMNGRSFFEYLKGTPVRA
jgi:arylsulfatase A-like enzyme